jgi:phage shock protein C
MEQKKLFRSSTNKMVCGVCAGIADYINVDPTIIRLAWVVFSFAGGAGVLAYIIAAIIMPVQA